MQKITYLLLFFVTFASAGEVQAQVVHEDPRFSGEMQILWQKSRERDEQMDLFVANLYLERSIRANTSVFVYVYYDQEFVSAVAGPSYKFGDLQVGIAAGVARYDKVSRPMGMLWAYYTSDRFEALISYERYGKERTEPQWLKGYGKYKVNDRWAVGFYGEKGFGVGPIISWKYHEWMFSVTHSIVGK